MKMRETSRGKDKKPYVNNNPIFAPSQRQAQTTYNKIKSRLNCKNARQVFSDPDFANIEFDTFNGTTVSLTNGSFVTAMSASDGSNIEGESFHLIILEECQDISNYKILKSIHPMGASTNATLVKLGTSTNYKGNFYDVIHNNKKRYENGEISIRNHFEYDYKIISKYNPKYKKYVEKEKQRLGEKSDEFQMSYCLTWILSRGMFIEVEEFEQNNLNDYMGTVLEDTKANHVAGIDVAGVGDDSTIVTITEVDWNMPVIQESKIDLETGEETVYNCYNTYIKAWLEIRNVRDYEEQYGMITEFLRRFRLARVVCDATKERSLADRLNANLPCEVIPFVFTQKSKSDLYKHFSKEIASGRVQVPSDEATMETEEFKRYTQQMYDLQKGWSGQYLSVSHPNESGSHDDYCDSHALAVWGSSFEGTVNESSTHNRSALFGKSAKSKGRLQAKRRRA